MPKIELEISDNELEQLKDLAKSNQLPLSQYLRKRLCKPGSVRALPDGNEELFNQILVLSHRIKIMAKNNGLTEQAKEIIEKAGLILDELFERI